MQQYVSCFDRKKTLAIIPQNGENYQNSTIREIRENLIEISPKVQNVRIVYCPAHQGIKENELAD